MELRSWGWKGGFLVVFQSKCLQLSGEFAEPVSDL